MEEPSGERDESSIENRYHRLLPALHQSRMIGLTLGTALETRNRDMHVEVRNAESGPETTLDN